MGYGETKVYFDGSHYIAIPHTERPPSKRKKKVNIDDMAPIKRKENISYEPKDSGFILVPRKDGKLPLEVLTEQSQKKEITPKTEQPEKPAIRISEKVKTKKDLFEELYIMYIELPYKAKEESILQDMAVFFPNDGKLSEYVKDSWKRKSAI